MGLILDSSVLIDASRKGRNARQALAEISVHAAGEDVALSTSLRSGPNDKCPGRRGSPFKPNEGLNGAPKAFVAGAVSFVILLSTRPSEFGCSG
jgi:hypothetical protein